MSKVFQRFPGVMFRAITLPAYLVHDLLAPASRVHNGLDFVLLFSINEDRLRRLVCLPRQWFFGGFE